MPLRRTICLFTLLAVSVGCTRSSANKEVNPDRLLLLMKQRLLLMHEVARWKWNEDRPIADPARERQSLDYLATQGQDSGLEQSPVRKFFAAQIEAAKRVQEADFLRWKKAGEGKFSNIRPLAELRQEIDALNEQLLAEFVLWHRTPRPAARVRERAEAILTGEGIDAGVRERAIKPLIER